MNSRTSWSVDNIDPSVRERAEAAARRAGMSLNDWLNSTLGSPASSQGRSPSQGPGPDVTDIHQQLDSITRQIDRISSPAPRNEATREQGVARQLNDAISRLDARLSQISSPQQGRPAPVQPQRPTEAVDRAANQVYSSQPAPQPYRASPPLSPSALDVAVAEIAARQTELDGPRATPSRAAPPIAPSAPAFAPPPASAPAPAAAPAPRMAPPPAPGPDFSALEKHLFKITSQIDALQARPDHSQAISGFRGELAEIRTALTEAMPRRAIETIESEIRALSRRIDDSRQGGIDNQVLGNIENALNEIRDVLRSLKSAEQLAGYDEAIRNLGTKLDTILQTNNDPRTVQQLENAISALRSIVSNVASNDALVRLSDDVRTLSSRVDQIAQASSNADSFAALEQRIAALTTALESRERPQYQDNSEQIENALRGLSERIDHLQVGNDSSAAIAHLEQRVVYLLERLEASNEQRAVPNLGRVEDGLHDILRHLENQHAALASFADNQHAAFASFASSHQQQRAVPEPRDEELIELLKRELSDIRFTQSKTDRQTQDSLEAVNSTLGHVVDRLAIIEGDLRSVRSAPVPQPAPQATSPRVMTAPQPRPELPNPAASQSYAGAPMAPHYAAAPREFHAAETAPVASPPAPYSPAPLAISEILVPGSSRPPQGSSDLPPDHPLEPGTRPGARVSTPSERIAASESAISELPAAPKDPVSSSSFIAAARRAAQAAASQPQGDKPRPAKAEKSKVAAKPGKDGPNEPSTVTSKIRSLLVGASVVVIVLGSFKMAMNFMDIGFPMMSSSEKPASQPSTLTPSDNKAQAPAPQLFAPEPAPAPAPSMTSPAPVGRQSMNRAAPGDAGASTNVAIPQTPAAPAAPAAAPAANGDVTGSIPRAATGPISQGGLPEQIGGPNLRAAALRGDAAAAYEVGVRFAEGKGVAQNIEEAAKWYDRAAKAGVIPATFRLGTLYEKGMGVKKDIDTARRYYVQAAERGNAKAMHNLAVLDADGNGKPDYKGAANWFRKAADHGVADSQFNLGILYARGIGVEQNLAESFKWFSLAAAQGDGDAAHKRDDIAKRLDAQSLAAAKLAIQTFTAEPQPDDAINAATPPGGWDSASPAVAPAGTKPAARAVMPKRSAVAAATPR